MAQKNYSTPDHTNPVGSDLAQSKYNFQYTVFPNDLGMDNNGHYMIININVPTKVPVNSDALNGLALRQPAGAFTGAFQVTNNVSKLDTLRYGKNTLGGVQRPTVSIPRYTRRIEESIALHMPTPLIFNQHNIYEEISLTALAGKAGIGSVSYLGEVLSGLSNSPLGKAVGGLTQILDGAGKTYGAISSLGQRPINPAVEVLFANTPQRQFTFEVLMAPRNEKESLSIQKIVQTLRFHGSPEYSDFAVNGLHWIPPADFDITFFNKGHENFNILRINTCVLERIEVDYSPSGVYSTFRNGHPVAVRLSLGFRELEPLHKLRILQGF